MKRQRRVRADEGEEEEVRIVALKIDKNRVTFQYNAIAFFFQIFAHFLMYFSSVGNFADSILVYIPFFMLTIWNGLTVLGSNAMKRFTHNQLWMLNTFVANSFFYIAMTTYIAFTNSENDVEGLRNDEIGVVSAGWANLLAVFAFRQYVASFDFEDGTTENHRYE